MKKTNKKGFTIVELVIVIAVIAILAGVLIPTFSNVIQKANKSRDEQQARNAYVEYVAEANADQIGARTEAHYVYLGEKYAVEITGQKVQPAVDKPTDNKFPAASGIEIKTTVTKVEDVANDTHFFTPIKDGSKLYIELVGEKPAK